jgi:hypothetical protein
MISQEIKISYTLVVLNYANPRSNVQHIGRYILETLGNIQIN